MKNLRTRNNAKRREPTWGYAKGVDGINTWAAHSNAQISPPSGDRSYGIGTNLIDESSAGRPLATTQSLASGAYPHRSEQVVPMVFGFLDASASAVVRSYGQSLGPVQDVSPILVTGVVVVDVVTDSSYVMRGHARRAGHPRARPGAIARRRDQVGRRPPNHSAA